MNGQEREQTELLRNIWNEMKLLGSGLNRRIDLVRTELGGRIDQTNERLDQTNERLDLLGTELGGRIDQTNERLGVVEMVLREVADQQLHLVRHVRTREDQQDDAIEDLQQRVGRIEAALPTPGTP